MSNEQAKTLESLKDISKAITNEINKTIVGQQEVIENFLTALFAGGHCLLEGVPGLAKTMLVSTLAEATDMKFSRIQFTPDLMPSDITGTEILAEIPGEGKRQFQFLKGPVFANIILADEINRTPPKTQSSLLEAMQEYQVTAGNNTFELDKPFLVMATQNPIEQEGTYPLPEAQLDRFMFNILIDYPSHSEEVDIVKLTTVNRETGVKKVIDAQEIVRYQNFIRQIPVSDHVMEYAVNLVRATRPGNTNCPDYIKTWVSWGAGPRASQYLIIAAKTRAALDGRPTPSIEDVKKAAHIVLRHRILVSFAAEAEGLDSNKIVSKLLESIKP
ncbi:MAG: MoxR family ATPase [Candidatus Cloacimonetes bacterium]|nr:MoxR family ATPase [Candidatus Cloacimonadota bacterium]